MFRGVGKQVVVLKNPESKIFEEAIFILREKSDLNKKDLLTECERIISKNCTSFKPAAESMRTIRILTVGGSIIIAAIAAVIVTALIL